MKLSMLRETLTETEQLGALDNIHDYVSEMFSDMRSLTFDLCPPVLYGIGFERARAEAGSESSGGLGLFTVRERLEYFGGSLEIESRPGEGSRVILAAALTSRGGLGQGTER